MATATTETPTRMEDVEIAKIRENGNPRQKMEAQPLNELVASIKERGVLQPVRLREEDGGFVLVAGHRRVKAAGKAGLKTVPAIIAAGDSDLTDALIENVQRVDLSPVEEGLALAALQDELDGASVRDLASRTGKSKDWVSDRLRLSRLPMGARKSVAAGDTKLHEAVQLAAFNDLFGAELTEQLVAVRHQVGGARLDTPDGWARMLASAIGAGKIVGVVHCNHWQGFEPKALGLADDVTKELAKERKAIGPEVRYGHKYNRMFKFDVGPAKKAKVLIEFGNYEFITDKAFLEKSARAQLKSWKANSTINLKEEAEKAGIDVKGKKPDEIRDAVNAHRSQQQAEHKKAGDQERANRAEQAAKLHKANLEFGKKLREKFAKVTLDVDIAKALFRAVIDKTFEGCGYIAYVDDRHQKVDEESGEIVYADYNDIDEAIEEQLAAAKTPEEVVGLLFQVLAACEYAQEPAAPARYSHYYVPSIKDTPLDALVKKERVVPKALRDIKEGKS